MLLELTSSRGLNSCKRQRFYFKKMANVLKYFNDMLQFRKKDYGLYLNRVNLIIEKFYYEILDLKINLFTHRNFIA